MRHRRTRTSTGRSAWRPCMPSMPAISWQNEVMDATRIPEDVAAAIEECWPDGVVEEFDTDESYCCDIHAALERDLRKIPGAELLWQTEALEEPDPEAPDGELATVTYPGRGRYGCGVAVSLATPFAAIRFSEHAHFEDGSTWTPDPGEGAYSDEKGEPVDLDASYREAVGENAFAKLENLRARIAKVLAKHGVVVLDQAILDLPAPELKADSEVFMNETLSVRDAFFFRGV